MYGPLFEHWLGYKPWDLERLTLQEVAYRLAWIKRQQSDSDGGEPNG